MALRSCGLWCVTCYHRCVLLSTATPPCRCSPPLLPAMTALDPCAMSSTTTSRRTTCVRKPNPCRCLREEREASSMVFSLQNLDCYGILHLFFFFFFFFFLFFQVGFIKWVIVETSITNFLFLYCLKSYDEYIFFVRRHS